MFDRVLFSRRAAFTLVELLVVIGITGLLIAMMLPAVQFVRESARRTSCTNNLRQLGLALHQHETAERWFPAGYRLQSPTGAFVSSILPFLEQASLGYDLGRDWDDPTNRTAIRTQLPVLICPSAPAYRRDDLQPSLLPSAGDYTCTHGVNPGYCLLAGWAILDPPVTNGVLIDRPLRLSEILDGTSFTFLLQEDAGRPELWRMGRRASGNAGSAGWADPQYEIALDGSDYLTTGSGQANGLCVMNCTNDNEAYSFHRGAVGMLYADGAVKMLSDDTSTTIFAALTTRACRESIANY